jgi:hypothetical protein
VGVQPSPVNRTWGIFPLNKFCCCLQILVHGEASDKLDEYFQISESMAAKYLIDFCGLIDHLFGDYYYLNRCPTPAEQERVSLSAEYEEGISRNICIMGLQAF